MSRASLVSPRASLFALGLILLFAGCSTTRQSSRLPSSPPELFPTPEGWYNFSADSSRHTLAWFVRNDYKAEIIIETVRGARPRDAARMTTAQLIALVRGVFSMDTVNCERVLQGPEREGGDGEDRWSYVLQNQEGDWLRVVITTSVKFGIVRSATTVLADQTLADVERVQDALLAGPLP
jgi:hypothetical protein